MAETASNTKVLDIAARCRGPGPAKYLLPGTVGYKFHDFSKMRAPAFVFGQRHKKFQTQFSPGPTYMIPTSLTCRGKDTTPSYSLYSRPVVRISAQIPGPGTHILACTNNLEKKWKVCVKSLINTKIAISSKLD